MSHVAQKQDVYDPEVIRPSPIWSHRAAPRGALPPHRGRRARHEPQGVERVEGKLLEDLFRAARRASPASRSRATRRLPRSRPRRAAPRLYALSDGVKESSGSSSTPRTSCATTRRRSPGTRAACTTGSTPTSRWSRRASPPFGEGLQVMIYMPDREALRAHLRLLRARRLQHRRGQDPHHARRLRARHLRRHGPGRRRALPRHDQPDRDRARG